MADTPEGEIGKVHPGLRVAGFGRDTEPVRRFIRIARDSSTGQIEQAECPRCGPVTSLRGAAIPNRRLRMIRGECLAALGVKVAYPRRRFRIPGHRSSAQP